MGTCKAYQLNCTIVPLELVYELQAHDLQMEEASALTIVFGSRRFTTNFAVRAETLPAYFSYSNSQSQIRFLSHTIRKAIFGVNNF